jgi:hypothetical protein
VKTGAWSSIGAPAGPAFPQVCRNGSPTTLGEIRKMRTDQEMMVCDIDQ